MEQKTKNKFCKTKENGTKSESKETQRKRWLFFLLIFSTKIFIHINNLKLTIWLWGLCKKYEKLSNFRFFILKFKLKLSA